MSAKQVFLMLLLLVIDDSCDYEVVRGTSPGGSLLSSFLILFYASDAGWAEREIERS